jgi:uncharacterized membrane protein YkvA (DUF1232 family)
MRPLAALRAFLEMLERNTLTAYFGARDRRTPLAVRALALAVAAYVLSPIDLIPDWVYLAGGLDDLVLVPLGLALVLWLLPAPVLQDARARAEAAAERPIIRVAPLLMIALWVIGITLLTHGWMHGPGTP